MAALQTHVQSLQASKLAGGKAPGPAGKGPAGAAAGASGAKGAAAAPGLAAAARRKSGELAAVHDKRGLHQLILLPAVLNA